MDMDEDIHQYTVQQLRDEGYAVVIFNPEELGEADPGDLEDLLVERGNNFIDFMNPDDEEE